MHACCAAGHAYGINGSIAHKSQQASQQPDKVRPNISLLQEELKAQWHDQLNEHLGSIVIKPSSNRKVWWSCAQCPDNLPHVWEASVNNRTQGTGCPLCSGHAICQHNTLARKAPQVALLWDSKKNHPVSPDQVTASSGRRAHWKCSDCLHEWQASVMLKARRNSGCPQCTKANGNVNADGTRQKHPSFAKAKHALLEQWDDDRNRKNGNFPGNTTLQSHKLIWWRCHACPMGREHSWQARAASRTSRKHKTGCPFCAGHKLCECNSLETVYPDVAADFDVQINGLSASEVTNSTSTKYSWLSDEPGAKKRAVNDRIGHARRRSPLLIDTNDL